MALQKRKVLNILHVCSSVLLRPNGIVRSMCDSIELQLNPAHSKHVHPGHNIRIVTDSCPTQQLPDVPTYWLTETSSYVPNMHPTRPHVWLQVDYALVDKLEGLLKDHIDWADLIIVYDLHAYLAASKLSDKGVFIQYESDVLNQTQRHSYISDEYLALQISIVNDPNNTWHMGMTIDPTDVTPRLSISTPPPFNTTYMERPKEKRGLLYIGEATERKGAKEFMDMARRLNVVPTVITWDKDAEVFKGANVYRFELHQKKEMLKLISEHSVAFFPNKNECPCIAVLECLQYMPVVVNKDYAWTRCLKKYGVEILGGDDIYNFLKHRLANPNQQHPLLLLTMEVKRALKTWKEDFVNWPAVKAARPNPKETLFEVM